MTEIFRIIFDKEGRAGGPPGLYEVDTKRGYVTYCPVPIENRGDCSAMIYGCCAEMCPSGTMMVPPNKTIGFVCVNVKDDPDFDWSTMINPAEQTWIEIPNDENP